MTMPSSGALNMGGTSSPVSVAYELGLGLTSTISMDQPAVRTLAGVGGSGTSWGMNSLYGKSNRVIITVTISSTTTNYTANTAKASGYVAGLTDVTFVISSGVVIGSASTGSYAFTVDSSWSAGDTVTINNQGTVIGASGNGGKGGDGVLGASGNGSAGTSGGPAVSVARTVTWTNTGTAGGGAGGGGGGACYYALDVAGDGGGGGGGGRGYYGGTGGAGGTTTFGGGFNGTAGGAGSSSAAGSGGAGWGSAGSGGSGGALGSSGSTGGTNQSPPYSGGSGGSAGALLIGKSYVNSGAGISGGTYAGSQSG
jgi:hypothetical protein